MVSTRGDVTIAGSSGETYVLRFGTNQICRIQEALNQSIGDVLAGLHGQRAMSAIRTIVRLSLIQPADATEELAGDIIDDVGLVAITETFGSVFGVDLGGLAPWQSDLRTLRVNAATFGVTSERFWDLTMDDLSIEREGAQQRMDQWYQLALFLAWHIEAFNRTKRLPELRTLLARMAPKPKQNSQPATTPTEWWRVRKEVMRMKSLENGKARNGKRKQEQVT